MALQSEPVGPYIPASKARRPRMVSRVRPHQSREGNGWYNLTWHPDDIAELTRLWLETPSSATQIAAHHLGGRFTRNAILGKIHRLGLKRENPIRANTARTVAPTVRFKSPRRAAVAGTAGAAMLDAPPPLPITLMELGPHSCRWAVNDGGPYLFCGVPSAAGFSYCEKHCQRAFTAAAKPTGPFVWRRR